MVFKQQFLPGIAAGTTTRTLRRWRRPGAKVGGRYRAGSGQVDVTGIEIVAEADAPAVVRQHHADCGFESAADCLANLGEAAAGTEIYLVSFRYVAEARTPQHVVHQADDPEAVIVRLAAMDRRRNAPWTRRVLELIEENPGRRAGDLAPLVDRELKDFKQDVRKLKALGLTISGEVGYRLAPLGAAVLEQLRG